MMELAETLAVDQMRVYQACSGQALSREELMRRSVRRS